MLWTFLQSFSFVPHMALRRWFLYVFFANIKFRLPWQPIKFSGLDKIHMVGRGLLNEHSLNVCQNTCCEIAINANFHFSHYKSMANISCHSYQSCYPIGTKNTIIHSPGLLMIYVKFVKNQRHGFRGDVVWKCWQTTDACLYYKLTYEPSAPWANKLEGDISETEWTYKDCKQQTRFDWVCSWDILENATSVTPLASA